MGNPFRGVGFNIKIQKTSVDFLFTNVRLEFIKDRFAVSSKAIETFVESRAGCPFSRPRGREGGGCKAGKVGERERKGETRGREQRICHHRKEV